MGDPDQTEDSMNIEDSINLQLETTVEIEDEYPNADSEFNESDSAALLNQDGLWRIVEDSCSREDEDFSYACVEDVTSSNIQTLKWYVYRAQIDEYFYANSSNQRDYNWKEKLVWRNEEEH